MSQTHIGMEAESVNNAEPLDSRPIGQDNADLLHDLHGAMDKVSEAALATVGQIRPPLLPAFLARGDVWQVSNSHCFFY